VYSIETERGDYLACIMSAFLNKWIAKGPEFEVFREISMFLFCIYLEYKIMRWGNMFRTTEKVCVQHDIHIFMIHTQ
jgi:hypothetical protein